MQELDKVIEEINKKYGLDEWALKTIETVLR